MPEEHMENQQIDELLCNIQIISDKATELVNLLLDKKKLDFEQVKNIYGNLEIICGKATTTQVFIEMNISDGNCPECGEDKILLNWDTGMLECQNSSCGYHRSIKPCYKLS